jgi:hypothetical protein
LIRELLDRLEAFEIATARELEAVELYAFRNELRRRILRKSYEDCALRVIQSGSRDARLVLERSENVIRTLVVAKGKRPGTVRCDHTSERAHVIHHPIARRDVFISAEANARERDRGSAREEHDAHQTLANGS